MKREEGREGGRKRGREGGREGGRLALFGEYKRSEPLEAARGKGMERVSDGESEGGREKEREGG